MPGATIHNKVMSHHNSADKGDQIYQWHHVSKEQTGKREFVAYTTDMWTSVQNIAFMCMTVHWVTPDWRLESAIMQTREVCEKHTGENISIRLADAATEWEIPEDKIAATVHDNGSNIKLAMNLLDPWPDQQYFAHTLQLSINSGLSMRATEKMLCAAHRLTVHLKRRTVSTEALHAKQVALGGVGASAEGGVEEQCKKYWQ